MRECRLIEMQGVLRPRACKITINISAESILIGWSKDEAFVMGPVEIATNAFHHLVVH